MSKLDFVKEEIAYLKMWLGVALASGVSLAGWLIVNLTTTTWVYIVAAVLGFVGIAYLCHKLHKTIKYQIKRLEKL